MGSGMLGGVLVPSFFSSLCHTRWSRGQQRLTALHSPPPKEVEHSFLLPGEAPRAGLQPQTTSRVTNALATVVLMRPYKYIFYRAPAHVRIGTLYLLETKSRNLK